MNTLLSKLKSLWCDLKCFVDSNPHTIKEDKPYLECILDVSYKDGDVILNNVIVNEIGTFQFISIGSGEFIIEFADNTSSNLISKVTDFYCDPITYLMIHENNPGSISYRGVRPPDSFNTPWERAYVNISYRIGLE